MVQSFLDMHTMHSFYIESGPSCFLENLKEYIQLDCKLFGLTHVPTVTTLRSNGIKKVKYNTQKFASKNGCLENGRTGKALITLYVRAHSNLCTAVQ